MAIAYFFFVICTIHTHYVCFNLIVSQLELTRACARARSRNQRTTLNQSKATECVFAVHFVFVLRFGQQYSQAHRIPKIANIIEFTHMAETNDQFIHTISTQRFFFSFHFRCISIRHERWCCFASKFLFLLFRFVRIFFLLSCRSSFIVRLL